MASQTNGVWIFNSTVCSGVDKKSTKAPRHCPLWEEFTWPVHKGPVTRKMFPFDDVMFFQSLKARNHQTPHLHTRSVNSSVINITHMILGHGYVNVYSLFSNVITYPRITLTLHLWIHYTWLLQAATQLLRAIKLPGESVACCQGDKYFFSDLASIAAVENGTAAKLLWWWLQFFSWWR